jgi:hypothetical protein
MLDKNFDHQLRVRILDRDEVAGVVLLFGKVWRS